MPDIANLQLRVQSLEAEVADKRLKSLANSGGRVEKATDGVRSSFVKLAAPVLSAVSAITAFQKVLSVGRQFEILNAQLITATGSAENATIAFQAISDFATRTPYDLQQVTDGFVKLSVRGLDPSIRALTSYGDTAAATGKTLDQLVEAVADAATGEFERVKEAFNLSYKTLGDQVAFTFRGITTTVGKNARDIEKYLISIGENNFAGAMLQRMQTLDGALSNLNDEWNKVFRNISEQGVGNLIEDAARTAISVLEELNAELASGQLVGYLNAIASQFESTANNIHDSWNAILGPSSKQGIVVAATDSLNFITKSFLELPANMRTAIQLATVEISAIVEYGREYGKAFSVAIIANLDNLVEKSKAYGTAIGQALNPFDDNVFDLDARLKVIGDRTDAIINKSFINAEQRVDSLIEGRRESIKAILNERKTALDSFSDQIKEADKLRRIFDKNNEARQKDKTDVTAQFRQGGSNEKTETDSERKAREGRQKALEQLRLSLRTEEEVIQESYDKRLAIILDNTEKGSQQQNELKERLDKEFATQSLGELATPDTYDEELNRLEEFYQKRRDLILNNSALTEKQRTELEAELTKQRNDRLEALEKQRLATIFSSSASLFGNLADLSKQFAGEQNNTFKLLFAASKAFAIAESVVKIQQGIANASALPFPANLSAIASVVAATSSIVSTISGANFSGAYDEGGVIPQGKIGLVGEFGPELIQGPANITSRKETAEIFKNAGNESQQQPVQNNIRIVNAIDPSLISDFMGSEQGEQIIMNTIRNNPEMIRSVSNS